MMNIMMMIGMIYQIPDKILELRSDATEWVILDQCLENPRMEHVAFPITDEIETNFKEKYSSEDEK